MIDMETIGRYRLTQRIGAGSFATVYKGHDDELDVPVAVKVLADNWTHNSDVRRRFLAEARLLRRIRDERVVRVYDIGTANDGRPYFVMDYADGGSLEQLRRNLEAPGRALRLCAEAARALEVLHRHNMIHRDVTPGNILLSHSAAGVRVLLADLGVAKSMVERSGGTMTAGTPAFMALEQASGAPIDQRADIYSMAAVTYSLLTGHPPFPVKTLNDLLSRNPAIGPAPIADQIGAPPLLDQLLAASLSPRPEDRPPSAEIFAAALDSIADVMPGGDSYSPRPLAPSTNGPSPISTPSSLPTSDPHPVAPAPAMLFEPASSVGNSLRNSSPNSITPRNETPASMLENYLGRGRYQVAPPKERHTASFYVFTSLAIVALFALTVFLTITYLLN